MDHYISARVARYTYGIFGATRFNFSNPEHLQRFHYVFEDDVSHDMYVAGRFISILEKVRKWVSDSRQVLTTVLIITGHRSEGDRGIQTPIMRRV